MKLKLKAMTAAVCVSSLLALQAQAEVFKVALLLPFSGVYAGLGSHIENGFRLGLEQFADKTAGHQIVISREDTEAKPAVGLAKTKKAVLQDKSDVIVGYVSSAVLGSVRDFIHASKTPLLVANAGNDRITGEKCSPYITRLSFSNSQINRPLGGWVAGQGVKTVYVMAPDYAAGHQMVEAFSKTFTAAGGKVIGEAFPPLSGTKDYAPYLAAAKAAKPDAIYVFFAGGAAIAFVKQYDAFGMKEDIPLYAAGFLTSAAYVHVEGKAADGIIGALHYVPSLDNPENQTFQAAYQAKYKKLGSEFAVAGYDAGHAVANAVAASGGDKAKFKAALKNINFNGPRGPLSIDPATNNVVQNIYIYRNEFANGKVTQKVLATFKNVRDPANGCKL